MLSLIFNVFLLLVHTVCVYSTSVDESKTVIANVFEGLGYSPICVASALASCERLKNADFQFHLSELIPELKNILKDTKCSQIAPNSNKSFIENDQNIEDLIDLLRELKFERGKGKNLVLENCLLAASNSHSMIEELKRNISVLTVANKKPKNCWEIYSSGDTTSGVRVVYPFIHFPSYPVIVLCDQLADGGGWTYIHKRDTLSFRENFYRKWADYKNGFGTPHFEFWLGLENIHALTNSAKMELRVDLEDYEGVERWAIFKEFHIEDEASFYKLHIGKYSGTAGDSMARHNRKRFSTIDQDNDDSEVNCAIERHGAWWYTDCNDSNLNGFPYVRSESSNYHGIQWDTFHSKYYSLKRASMKVRPIDY